MIFCLLEVTFHPIRPSINQNVAVQDNDGRIEISIVILKIHRRLKLVLSQIDLFFLH